MSETKFKFEFDIETASAVYKARKLRAAAMDGEYGHADAVAALAEFDRQCREHAEAVKAKAHGRCACCEGRSLAGRYFSDNR